MSSIGETRTGRGRGGRRAPGAGTPPARGVIRVVLGEDGLLAREGLTAVIQRLDGIELVASCDDLVSLRAAIERTAPHVVLADLRLPPSHTDEGVRLAAELRRTRPQVGVILLGQHAEPVHATALLAEGARGRGYLLKERLRDQAELARAIRDVAAGGAVVDPRVVDEVLAARGQLDRSPLAVLTPRERETLALIAAGDSNSAIAESLGLTKRGVERHVNSIFAKLELGDPASVSRRVKAALMFLTGEGRLSPGPADSTGAD
jgi:DNA-binding NarL/FixJ family response regulator